jgi:hypothetical protein
MSDLILYDAMVLAITNCHRTDEVKEIRDKALALEHYARQAQNVEAERKAAEVRIRAERRAGELLKEEQKQPGKRTDLTSPSHSARLSDYAESKERAKISDYQAERWQKLADVPQDKFEAALSNPDSVPSTQSLINAEEKPEPAPPDRAIWLWGRLMEFEREGILNQDINEILAEMPDILRKQSEHAIQELSNWLMEASHARKQAS